MFSSEIFRKIRIVLSQSICENLFSVEHFLFLKIMWLKKFPNKYPQEIDIP